ncbi:MAG: hypothetical protein ACREEM_33135 [Blastocatellia bacterium]
MKLSNKPEGRGSVSLPVISRPQSVFFFALLPLLAVTLILPISPDDHRRRSNTSEPGIRREDRPDANAVARIQREYGKLPIRFEANQDRPIARCGSPRAARAIRSS